MISTRGQNGSLAARRAKRAAAAALSVAAILSAPAALAMPIEDAVQLAIRTHPSILAASQLQRAAEQGVTTAGAGLLPVVDFTYGNGWARTNSASTRGRATRGPGDPQSVTLFRFESSLTVTQLVYDGLATLRRKDAARARLDGASFSVFGAEEAIALRAAAAYLNAVRGRALVRLAQQYVAAHEDVISGLTAQVEAGAGTQADVDQAEGRRALAQSTLMQFESGLRDAEAGYREAVGGWPEDDVAAPSLAPSDLPPSREDAVAEALLGHPSILAAQQNIRSLEFNVRAAGAVFRPSITFKLTATRNENAGGAEVPTADVTGMFNLTYNLYRGGADAAAADTARVLLTEARLRLDETRRQIEQSARIGYNAYELARAQLPQFQTAAEAGAQARADFTDQFDLGERTLLDRLAVEDQAFAADTGLVNGEIAVLLGHYQVLAALGRLRAAF